MAAQLNETLTRAIAEMRGGGGGGVGSFCGADALQLQILSVFAHAFTVDLSLIDWVASASASVNRERFRWAAARLE